ncbi:MAG: hypothetical protein AAGG38_11470, partial [Planctomycetota bacterium]
MIFPAPPLGRAPLTAVCFLFCCASLVVGCGTPAAATPDPGSAAPASASAPPTAAEPTEINAADTDTDADDIDTAGADEAAAPAPLTAEDWLERLEAAAPRTRTLTATLRLTQTVGLLDETSQRFGRLAYAAADPLADPPAPERFRVEFNRRRIDDILEDLDQRYVFDGRWLLDLDAQDRVATRRELAPAGQTQTLGLDDGPFLLPLSLKKDPLLARFTAD